jgi:hypothetical protein
VRARDGEHRVAASGRHFGDGFVQMRNADERRRALNQGHHVDFYWGREEEEQQIIVGGYVDDDDDRYSVYAFLLNETAQLLYIIITVNIIPA